MKNCNTCGVTIAILLRSTRKLLLSAVMLCIAYLPAVSKDLPEFGVAPLSGPDGMVLIVGGPLLHPSTAATNDGWIGYHIYRRKAGDTGFVRITGSPLSRPGSLAELERSMGGPIDGFERFAGLSNKNELWKSIEQNDTSIIPISFLSRNFRRALGLLIVDTKVERNVVYEYRATLVASNGTESAPSEPQKATFGVPLLPLLGPTDIKAKSTDQGVVLTWKVNPADSGAFSWSVYRCPDSAGSFLRLNLAALTVDVDSGVVTDGGSFIDTTAKPGRTYYYAVVSTDYAGNESPRHAVPVSLEDISRPAIPQNVYANPSGLGIAITWDTVPGFTVAGYNIYRSTDADSNFTRLNTALLPADTGYFEDKSTTLVDRYFYRVTAVNRSGRESEKSARALSLYANRRSPIPPQSVHAVPQPNGILVSWQACDEPDVRGYYVFRADSYNGVLSQVSPLLGRDTTAYLDTARYLSPTGQYWYLVQAVNYTGIASNYSVPAVASTDRTLAVDAPRSFFGYLDGSKVRLFWTRLDDNTVSGYNLYRAREADTLRWERLTAAPLTRDAAEFTDSTAAMEYSYLYQVRAVSNKGIEGPASHNMRVTFFEAAPLPPGGVRITPSGRGLKVVWSKTYQPSVAGYRIYRRSDTEASVSLTTQPLSTATTEYKDSSAKNGIRYYYSVSCVDQTGREGNRSTEVSYLGE